MAIVKPEMMVLPYIQKTREYLDYVERHINNVSKAWQEVQDKCRNMNFIYDDYIFFRLNGEVSRHDVSKLSSSELVQYRAKFYPTKYEDDCDFGLAWEHHKKHNPHHWETWTNISSDQELNCVHMVIDWLAMSYEFGDTPRKYYEANKERIKIPDWAVEFINEIFNCLESA